MTKKLKLLLDKNLKPNWTTILVGWEGPGKYPSQLTPKEVIEFATELVADDDNQTESVWMLAGTSENDVVEIKSLIVQLAQTESANREIELRKWRVILVEESLSQLSDEPLYGLIELTEMWEKFGYPNDSPHVIQGVNNSLSPQEYYTQDNYDKTIKYHREWVESELGILRNIQ